MGGRTTTLVAALLLVLPAWRAAKAQPDTTADRAAIDSLERAWLLARDTVVLSRILAPDFVHVVPTGQTIGRAEHMAWAASHPRPAWVRVRFDALRVRLYGDAAIANGIVSARDSAGRPMTRTAFTDVFVRRDGRWRAVSAQEAVIVPAGASPSNRGRGARRGPTRGR